VAITLTVPDAPATHFATPVDEMVAIAGFDTDQLPEYGATKVTVAGEGGWLNVPDAVNCASPLGEWAASATAGDTFIDCSSRGEFVPHPLMMRARTAVKKSGGASCRLQHFIV
jgi:hypothetical protein